MIRHLARALALAVACVACHGAPERLGAGTYPNPTADGFSYAAGASGTFVVPAGYFVTGWWAHSASGGTVTFTPTGPRMFPTCASWDAGADASDAAPPATCRATGSAITIPASSSFGLSIPVLTGSADELGDGSTFVFTGTDSYVVTMSPHA